MNKTNSLWKMSINIRTMGSYKLPVFCTIDSARLVSIMFTIAAFSGCGYNIEKSKDFFIKFLKFTVLHFYIFLFQFFNIFIAYSLEITGRQATFFTLIFLFHWRNRKILEDLVCFDIMYKTQCVYQRLSVGRDLMSVGFVDASLRPQPKHQSKQDQSDIAISIKVAGCHCHLTSSI